MIKVNYSIILSVALLLASYVAEAGDIMLPPPDLKGGKPLMECLSNRKTLRNFDAAKSLTPQQLSDIFYAADGISRQDGRKTVPTARNAQNQRVYGVMADGVYLYRPKTNSLELIVKGDRRAECTKLAFVKKAPLLLVYVAEPGKVGANEVEQKMYAGNHAGYAAQNVYLYCASEGLATVVLGMIHRDVLSSLLKLPSSQIVVYAQAVAVPVK